MKICIIADGRSTHARRWARYFGARHEVHFITYEPSGVPMEGVTEHVLPSWTGNLYLSFWPRHIRLMQLVRSIQPDLVHAHFIAKYGFHLPFLGMHPCVVSAWGDDILILPKKSRLIRFFTHHVLKNVDRVYAVSQDIERQIREDYGILPGKVRYVPFGINTSQFFPKDADTGLRKDRIDILSNRGYFPVYDTGTLVRSFSLAYEKDPRLHLTLKGDGPEENAVRTLVQSLGLQDAVTFLGKTAYSEVPADYRGADIFITTSISDGTPVSILEAMATGLPCIATSVGGTPEWITDGTTGILVPPRSPEKAAAAILRLARDENLRKTLGKNARQTILERGEWNTLMTQVEKDYEELVRIYGRKQP